MLAPLTMAAMLAITPAAAQNAAENDDLSEGLELLNEGTRLLLRGLMGEIEPALRELEDALGELNAYYPPEVLPNGDILIRRKVPKPVPPTVPEDGEIEL